MGEVWVAELEGVRGFRRRVALKMMLPEVAASDEAQHLFFDEARIAAAVHHPNVCEIYDFGEDQGVLFLAMEWIRGTSVARLLRKGGAFDPALAAWVVAEAAAGLHAAHELRGPQGELLRVVHRDVSPDNVLLSAAGEVKVADFGIATSRHQLHPKTATGIVRGKVGYMAPEQIVGEPIDRRADVFALGAVLYEATVGVRPFAAPSEGQILYRVLEGAPTSPRETVASYPPILEAIVLKALAKDRAERFASAAALAEALEGWLASTGRAVGRGALASRVSGTFATELEEQRQAFGSIPDIATLPTTRAMETNAAGPTPTRVEGRPSYPSAPVLDDEARRRARGSVSNMALEMAQVPLEPPAPILMPPAKAAGGRSPGLAVPLTVAAMLTLGAAAFAVALQGGSRGPAPTPPPPVLAAPAIPPQGPMGSEQGDLKGNAAPASEPRGRAVGSGEAPPVPRAAALGVRAGDGGVWPGRSAVASPALAPLPSASSPAMSSPPAAKGPEGLGGAPAEGVSDGPGAPPLHGDLPANPYRRGVP